MNDDRMTELLFIYRFYPGFFDNRGQLKLIAGGAGEIFIVVRHVAVDGVCVVVHVLDFYSERKTINAIERVGFFLIADANSERDLLTFDLDADGFRDIAKNLALLFQAARAFFYLFKKQIPIQLVGVEQTIAEVHFREGITLIPVAV